MGNRKTQRKRKSERGRERQQMKESPMRNRIKGNETGKKVFSLFLCSANKSSTFQMEPNRTSERKRMPLQTYKESREEKTERDREMERHDAF